MAKEETELEKNLRIMDKCIREISREDLNGKYQKAFKDLRKKVNEEANALVALYIIDPVVMSRGLTPEECEKLQEIVDVYRDRLQKEIYKNRSANGFYEALYGAQSAVFAYIKEHGGFVDDTKLPQTEEGGKDHDEE